MCGIAGMLGHPDTAAARRMMDAMRSRGPDDSGLYEDADAVLGHRRLSIIDLSAAGRQPMSRADGRLWIVFNGEIYNYRELRTQLEGRGHTFRSRSDTEVLLALYEDLGTDCLARLRGMFAFAILDRRGPAPFLFLARDHFGIKPVVYATGPDRFLFASDIPGLMAAGLVDAGVDPVALVQYLMHGHVVQPRTILKAVRILPAGHALIVKRGEAPRLWRYWDLDFERCRALAEGMSPEDQAARLRSLLLDSAKAQMVSDVPLGAFLSGGIDSCALVALMMRVSGQPVHTFSVGFAGVAPDLDETAAARRSARHLGSVHEELEVRGRDVADALPEIAAGLGQPTVDGVNMYFVSKAARRGVTVALTGLGGDELFAGYPWFTTLVNTWSPGASPDPLRYLLGTTGLWRLIPRSSLREACEFRAMRTGLSRHYAECHMLRAPSSALRLAGSPMVRPEEVLAYGDEDDPRISDIVSRVSRLDAKMYMCCQLLRDADAASMAHSLEVRVPFLDVDLAEFSFGLPGASKLRRNGEPGAPIGKRILVEAVRDLIPEWTYSQPKRGFAMPFAEWLRGPLRPLAEDVMTDRDFRGSGLLDFREVDGEWTRFRAGLPIPWTRVWTVLMLGLWWRGLRNGSRSASPPVPAAAVR